MSTSQVPSANMNVYAVGASRNTGYYTAIRLLAQGATVTFLLRNPSAIEADPVVNPYIRKGKAYLIKGDALKTEDVAKGWEEALRVGNGTVDLALFTIGGGPSQASFSLCKGLVIDPPDLVTHCFLNLVRTIPISLRSPLSAQPRIVTISSAGLTKAGHKKLPAVLKPLYGYILAGPHEDKLGAETVAAHYVGRDFVDGAKPEVLAPSWADEGDIVESGGFKKIVVIRPTLLTDGECRADQPEGGKLPYKLVEDDIKGYSVSRKDVAHFIVDSLMQDRVWAEWEGKCVGISY